ncbi:MAG: arylmalonate decarboxylase [Rhodospirillaceae bacterium]
MTDARAWRRKFGVMGPSTNTIVQPDFDDLRVPGVTNHYSRILVKDGTIESDEQFMALTRGIADNVIDAVRSVMTCAPDYLVMGMSAVTFYGGAKGADEFLDRIESESKIKASIGSHSCVAALKAYGGIKRISFVSPYYPSANAEVKQFFLDHGFETVRETCLQCPSAIAISEVQEDQLVDVLQELDGPDVDAIVQVGTNMSMMRLAGFAETWLRKPVISINAATYWHALRANGIADKVQGFGRLLEDF